MTFRRLRFARVAKRSSLDTLRVGNPRHRVVIGWCDGRIVIKPHPSHKPEAVKACGAAFATLPPEQRQRFYDALRDGSGFISEREAIMFAQAADQKLIEVYGE